MTLQCAGKASFRLVKLQKRNRSFIEIGPNDSSPDCGKVASNFFHVAELGVGFSALTRLASFAYPWPAKFCAPPGRAELEANAVCHT